MSETEEQAVDERVRLNFECDAGTATTLKAMARAEERTLSAQLRVICQDAVADWQESIHGARE